MDDCALVFDRACVRVRRDRAAAAFDRHAGLYQEVATRLLDRLDDVRGDFPLALELGCHTGWLGRRLAGSTRIATLIQSDVSPAMARRAQGLRVAADEEALPFAEARFDLVLSALTLQLVNDLPGTLLQIRRVLKPDGLFLAALIGGDSLIELRRAWLEAEIEHEGGAGPRVAPMIDLRDAAALLQRAGLALPVADIDRMALSYDTPFALMQDLRGMGQSNALHARRRAPTRRATLMAAAARYAELYGRADGKVSATFEIIYLTGWAPDAAQPQPLKPGTGATSLAAALGGEPQR